MNAKHIYPKFDTTRTFTVNELLELVGRVAELEKQLVEAHVVIRQLYYVGDFDNWPTGLMPRVEAIVNKG